MVIRGPVRFCFFLQKDLLISVVGIIPQTLSSKMRPYSSITSSSPPAKLSYLSCLPLKPCFSQILSVQSRRPTQTTSFWRFLATGRTTLNRSRNLAVSCLRVPVPHSLFFTLPSYEVSYFKWKLSSWNKYIYLDEIYVVAKSWENEERGHFQLSVTSLLAACTRCSFMLSFRHTSKQNWARGYFENLINALSEGDKESSKTDF